MTSKGPGRFARAWSLGKRLGREKPVFVAAGLILASLLAGPAVEEVADRLKIMGIEKYQFVLAGFLLVGLLFAIALLVRVRPAAKLAPPLPPARISVRTAFSHDDLRQIRNGLHMDLYGGVAPDGGEIDKMYVRNPRIAVALHDDDLKDFIAFAAAWPIRKTAALKLIAGKITENALKATDILPAAQNEAAEYLLVPAFGVAENRRGQVGRDLYYELRRLIRRNYLTQPGRSVTLIATGYSDDGRDWCKLMGLETVCHVEMDGEELPICTRIITSEDA